MEKKFNHKIVENGLNQKWIDKKYFSTHDYSKRPYTIILPPPNVTGKLHLGHAWDGYIQDTLIRFQKLQGKDVNWVAGMDHAGIATQAKVEQRIWENSQLTRHDLGREKFLDQVWAWKDEFAQTIKNQWHKLGFALDYENEQFTMSDNSIQAVQKVFIEMYQQGLIYRGERAVNWDPVLQTVLSNIEVIHREVEQVMYYINYQIKDSDEFLEVATVRPETLFSDEAIGINPNHPTLAKYIGLTVIHPLTKEEKKVFGLEEILLDKGSGAMKISAHSELDVNLLNRLQLPVRECIDKSGYLNSEAGEFAGLDRFEAREKIVSWLKEHNLISKEIPQISSVGYSERSNAVVETLVQPQWFVKMEPLSKLIINDLENQGVQFFPDRFEDIIIQWMTNVTDWCISRQLWWGHRVPAWYKGNEIKVQISSPGEGWTQDEDVLDTWFSSGIAPFSFLGWPNNLEKVKHYYPTDLLVTGYDIIFFWVARMYFQSLFFMEEKPFKHVLLHGLIRAEDGRKMSKSLGNGIDPMDVVDQFGSDSLRWFLLTNSAPGQDIRYSQEKIESAWNLGNKIWNISRYIIEIMPESEEDCEESLSDKWIRAKLAKIERVVSNRLNEYEFTILGKELTKFINDDFSSWYIEMSKERPNREVALDILRSFLIIFHPFMPFLTDFIFNLINDEELLEQNWPILELDFETEQIDLAIEVVQLLRNFRNEKNLSNANRLSYYINSNLLNEEQFNLINRLALAEFEENHDALIPFRGEKIYIKLTQEQKDEEITRKLNHALWLKNEIDRASKMLKNESFVKKAPLQKIEIEQEKLARFKKELDELESESGK